MDPFSVGSVTVKVKVFLYSVADLELDKSKIYFVTSNLSFLLNFVMQICF